VEFMPYWANEIEKLVAAPGQKFGRTMQDAGRLRAINEHGSDDLEQLRAALPGSYVRLAQVLGELKDSDLALTGNHSRYGEKTLAWFIEDFVTHHLASHLEQLNACLAAVSDKIGL
ncbi:MAG TPA: DinB family protein, partial [Ktedonobacteraceae bacterium]|nr:DinB family protein [Ktedonobacteraceae bacterium]